MRWLPVIFIILVLGVSYFVIAERFKDSKHYSWIILSLLYLVGISLILFTPISIDGISIYVMSPGIGQVNKSRLYMHGVGFIENIILTVPLGMMLKKFVSQLPMIVVAFIGLIISSGIEITQYYMSHFFLINRSSDINDIIANTIGIVIGAIVVILYSYQKKLIE